VKTRSSANLAVLPRYLATVAAAAAMLAAPVPAWAVFLTSAAAFDAANPGLTTITFEGITTSATAYNASMTPGATISGTNAFVFDSSNCGASSDFFAINSFGAAASISFSPSVNAIGFNISSDLGVCGSGGVDGTTTVSLFSGATLLDTQTFTTATDLSTFAGWSGLGAIDSLSIIINSTRDFLALDNLRYGTTSVPEPGTLALFGLGLAGLGFARRRKLD